MFNKNEEFFQQTTSTYTLSEIYQQPKTWAKTKQIVKDNKDGLKIFLDQVFNHQDYEIIFTGAGTSEFVGNSIFPYIATIYDNKVKSYGTTDIVAAPDLYLNKQRHTLLVSFARSGNSPESVAAVDIANQLCQNVYHLFITCNSEGALAKLAQKESNCYCLNMPKETNDKSFAMTSSYSCMNLAAVLTLMQYKGIEDKYEDIIESGQKFLDNCAIIEKIIEEFDYQRITYLGSNCLKGVSQESALKTCELTAGNIMTTYDSTMGFRHGPKSVVKDDSLTVVYVSDDDYTYQYDYDIVKEIYDEHIGKILVVSGQYDQKLKDSSDYYISFDNKEKHNTAMLGLQFIIIGQLLGTFKSIKMGHTPDNPCSTGQVSRVVHGVYIHPYKK